MICIFAEAWLKGFIKAYRHTVLRRVRRERRIKAKIDGEETKGR